MKKLADPVMAEYAKEIGADGDLQQDQLDVVGVSAAGGKSVVLAAGLFLPAPSMPGPRMRKFIDGYYRLLNWLLVASGGDPDHPGQPADLLALHRR